MGWCGVESRVAPLETREAWKGLRAMGRMYTNNPRDGVRESRILPSPLIVGVAPGHQPANTRKAIRQKKYG